MEYPDLPQQASKRMSYNDDVPGNEPFFGFLEWMTVWALISGGVFPLLWRLDGLVRVIAIAVFTSIVAASGVALVNYRRRKMFLNG